MTGFSIFRHADTIYIETGAKPKADAGAVAKYSLAVQRGKAGGQMKVTETKVQSLEITEVERLDPIRVMAENYEPGRGRITITCYGKAWTAAWFAMGGDTVQAFFHSCVE